MGYKENQFVFGDIDKKKVKYRIRCCVCGKFTIIKNKNQKRCRDCGYVSRDEKREKNIKNNGVKSK